MAGEAGTSAARHRRSVSDAANDLRAAALRLDRDDLAHVIGVEAERWNDATTSIALIGAVGAGTSSVVRSLVGRNGTEPPAGPTTVPIVFRAGAVEQATLVTHDGAPIDVPIATLADAADPGVHRHAEVSVPFTGLDEHVVLVDTPGSGGIADRNGNAAYLVSRRADALIVVVDLTAPLSRPDVQTIVRCTDRFAQIILAGTRIDRIRGWERVLADSERSLAAAIPHVRITSVGVSSVLAGAAATADDPGERASLLAESGIAELARLIDTIDERRRQVRLANFTALLSAVSAELLRTGHARLAATESDTHAELDRLAAQRHELARAREDRSAWFVALADAVAAARDESTQDLARMVAELHAAYDERAASWRGSADELVDEFHDDLTTEAASFSSRLADRLESIVTAMVELTAVMDLDVHLDAAELVRSLLDDDDPSAPVPLLDGQHRLRATGSVVSMATSSTVLFGALHGAGGADIVRLAAYGAATLFAGLSAAATVTGARRARTRQQIRQEIRAATHEMTSSGPASMRAFFVQVQRGIERHLKEAARTRIAALEDEQARLVAISRSSSADRRRAAEVVQREITSVERAASRVRAVAGELNGAVVS